MSELPRQEDLPEEFQPPYEDTSGSTPDVALPDTDDITTIEGLNKPIIDIMGQQAVGAITPGTEAGPTDITSGVDLGAGAYTPIDQTVQTDELLTGPTDLTATGAAATAAQVQEASMVNSPTAPDAVTIENVERTHSNLPAATAQQGELSEGAIIDPNQVVDERTKAEMFERGSLAEAKTQTLAAESKSKYQVEQLMAALDSGAELPPYMSPAVRKAKGIMNSRGLGSSSMAAAAMVQAMLESSIPIAQSDAQAYATIQLQNLNNEQQTALANAATIAAMDRQNLDNRMKAAQQNAQSFLQMDMANLTNRQATETLTYQSKVQSLFTDQAAANAAKQFNATTQNQVNQFYDQLGATVETNNANRQAAMDQFNVDQSNSIAKYNAKLQDAREKFNSTMQQQIEQSNVLWRRSINTANTTEQNNANKANAAAILGITVAAQANLWQKYRDEIHYAFTSTENSAQRAQQLALTSLQNAFSKEMFDMEITADAEKSIGTYFGNVLHSSFEGIAQNLFKNIGFL